MPNLFAYLVFYSWPLVAWAMFARMPVERAFVWNMIAGYLLLPPAVSFDLPLLPTIDKFGLAGITSYVLTITVGRRKVPLLPRSWFARVLVLVYVFSVVGTVLTNTDPIAITPEGNPSARPTMILEAMKPTDMVAFVLLQAVLVLPFLVGRVLLASDTGRRELLRALMISGLLYTIPSLVEIRLSPQINVWVYGFFQHDFIQMMRDGGFRPLVFLPHALNLALFLVIAASAMAELARSGPKEKRGRYLLGAFYLVGVVLLCKSMASILYITLLIPLVLLTSQRLRILLATSMVIVAFVYPALRSANLVPLDQLVQAAGSYSANRAQSLEFRFVNEELLLARAKERPVFGWGGWNRNNVIDPETGRTQTITDSQWIVAISIYGVVNFIAMFGLVALPILLLWRRGRRRSGHDPGDGVATLALLIGIIMVDMLINATMYPYVWMIVGALLGRAEAMVGVPARDPAVPRMVQPTAQRAVLGTEPPAHGPRSVM